MPPPQQYIIIERFYPDKLQQMYKRFAEKGRMLPSGVNFINSWINEDVSICYQLMEAESPDQLNAWVEQWREFADFEIVRVISSAEAKAKVLGSA